MASLREARLKSRISLPLIRILPPLTSYALGIKLISVLLPEPVLPIKAMVSPFLAEKDISFRTASSPSG